MLKLFGKKRTTSVSSTDSKQNGFMTSATKKQDPSTKRDPVLHLPSDLMVTLFTMLDDNTLGSVCRVSKAWKAYVFKMVGTHDI